MVNLASRNGMVCGCDPGAKHLCDAHTEVLVSLRRAGVLEWMVEYAGVGCPKGHQGFDRLVGKLLKEPLGKVTPLLPDPELGQDVALIAHQIQTLRNKLRETVIRLRTAANELEML